MKIEGLVSACLLSITALLSPGCSEPGGESPRTAFPVDAHTVAYFGFEEGENGIDRVGANRWTLDSAILTDGYVGRGLSTGRASAARLDSVFADGAPQGSIELYIRPDPDFDSAGSYSILGTNGSRCNLFFSRGILYFLKNHAGVYRICKAPCRLAAGAWQKLAVTWGSGGMRLFAGDSLLAQNSDTSVYRTYPAGGREYAAFLAGTKNVLWLDPLGLPANPLGYYYWPGRIDEIRFSDIQRY